MLAASTQVIFVCATRRVDLDGHSTPTFSGNNRRHGGPLGDEFDTVMKPFLDTLASDRFWVLKREDVRLGVDDFDDNLHPNEGGMRKFRDAILGVLAHSKSTPCAAAGGGDPALGAPEGIVDGTNGDEASNRGTLVVYRPPTPPPGPTESVLTHHMTAHPAAAGALAQCGNTFDDDVREMLARHEARLQAALHQAQTCVPRRFHIPVFERPSTALDLEGAYERWIAELDTLRSRVDASRDGAVRCLEACRAAFSRKRKLEALLVSDPPAEGAEA